MTSSENCLCGRALVEERCSSCALAPDVCDCPPVEEDVPVRLLSSGDEVDGGPSPSPKRLGRSPPVSTSREGKVLVDERLPKPTSYRLDDETRDILAREAAARGLGVSSLIRMLVRKVDWRKI